MTQSQSSTQPRSQVPNLVAHPAHKKTPESSESENNRPSSGPSVNRDFEDRIGALPTSYIDDWVFDLKTMNKARVEKAEGWEYDYLSRKSLDYIFTICTRLEMPHDVRFAAALIFDRYMSIHTREAHYFLSKLPISDEKKKDQWTKTECNIIRQITLRVMSAVQIASKDSIYHDSLSAETVSQVLLHLGTPYTPRAVVRSEIRMLKILDYQMPQNPLDYAESILKTLSDHHPELSDLNTIWEHALLFMDIIFLFHNEIFRQLVKETLGEKAQFILSKKHLARVKADWILIGGSVVMAAIGCVHGLNNVDELSRSASKLLRVPAQDLIDLTVVILETVERENEKLETADEKDSQKASGGERVQTQQQMKTPEFCKVVHRTPRTPAKRRSQRTPNLSPPAKI